MKSKTLVSILQDLKNNGIISRNQFSKICKLSDETLAMIVSNKGTPMPETLRKISMGLEEIGYPMGKTWMEMYRDFMKEYGYLQVDDTASLKASSELEEIMKGIRDKEGFLYKIRVLAEIEKALERKKTKSKQH